MNTQDITLGLEDALEALEASIPQTVVRAKDAGGNYFQLGTFETSRLQRATEAVKEAARVLALMEGASVCTQVRQQGPIHVFEERKLWGSR